MKLFSARTPHLGLGSLASQLDGSTRYSVRHAEAIEGERLAELANLNTAMIMCTVDHPNLCFSVMGTSLA